MKKITLWAIWFDKSDMLVDNWEIEDWSFVWSFYLIDLKKISQKMKEEEEEETWIFKSWVKISSSNKMVVDAINWVEISFILSNWLFITIQNNNRRLNSKWW